MVACGFQRTGFAAARVIALMRVDRAWLIVKGLKVQSPDREDDGRKQGEAPV